MHEAVSEGVAEAFGRRGIEIFTGIDGVTRIEETLDGRRVVYSRSGEERALEVGAVVFAAGGHSRGRGRAGGAQKITRTLGFIPLARAERDGNEQLRAAEWELRSG